MTSRRDFIKQSAFASAFVIGGLPKMGKSKALPYSNDVRKPIVCIYNACKYKTIIT